MLHQSLKKQSRHQSIWCWFLKVIHIFLSTKVEEHISVKTQGRTVFREVRRYTVAVPEYKRDREEVVWNRPVKENGKMSKICHFFYSYICWLCNFKKSNCINVKWQIFMAITVCMNYGLVQTQVIRTRFCKSATQQIKGQRYFLLFSLFLGKQNPPKTKAILIIVSNLNQILPCKQDKFFMS